MDSPVTAMVLTDAKLFARSLVKQLLPKDAVRQYHAQKMQEEVHITHSSLIFVLDACRYDTFEQAYAGEFPGELQRAYSPATWTIPSHISMIRGILPGNSENRDIWNNDYQQAIYPLPLQHAYSFGVTAMSIMADFPSLENGISEYFDDWTDYYEEVSAETVAADVRTALQKASKYNDFFGLVNFSDTHHPYNMKGPDDLRVLMEKIRKGDISKEELQSWQREAAENVIHEINELRQVIPFGTQVIVTADHGDLHGENGWFHNYRKYARFHKKLFEVPLITWVEE